MKNYEIEMLKKLPYWFKVKKQSGTAQGTPLIAALSDQFNSMDQILEYAIEQLRIQTLDDNSPDVIYKTLLPVNLDLTKIDNISSNGTAIVIKNTIAQFLGVHSNGKYYIESYISNYCYIDTSVYVLYLRRKYDSDITITFNDGTTLIVPSNKTHIWNYHDEYGALLCTPRLNNETNVEYVKRLYDVFLNFGSSNTEGLLNGIGKELGCRTNRVWADGGFDYEIKDPMVVLNYIQVDRCILDYKINVYISENNTVILRGNPMYAGKERAISYISGIEMMELYNKDNPKLYRELYNLDGNATDLMKYYKTLINTQIPITWGHFIWDNSYWDTNNTNISSEGHIPNICDAKINGFLKYNNM